MGLQEGQSPAHLDPQHGDHEGGQRSGRCEESHGETYKYRGIMKTGIRVFISVFSFHIECFLVVNGVVDVGVDSLTVLLHMFLELLPRNVGPQMSDLPDGSPGPHVLRPLGEGVRGAGSQDDLSRLLRLSVLTSILIGRVSTLLCCHWSRASVS